VEQGGENNLGSLAAPSNPVGGSVSIAGRVEQNPFRMETFYGINIMGQSICQRCKRDVVREVFYVVGDGVMCLKCLTALGIEVDPESMYSAPRVRRVYYAARDIPADTTIRPEDITTVRPE